MVTTTESHEATTTTTESQAIRGPTDRPSKKEQADFEDAKIYSRNTVISHITVNNDLTNEEASLTSSSNQDLLEEDGLTKFLYSSAADSDDTQTEANVKPTEVTARTKNAHPPFWSDSEDSDKENNEHTIKFKDDGVDKYAKALQDDIIESIEQDDLGFDAARQDEASEVDEKCAYGEDDVDDEDLADGGDKASDDGDDSGSEWEPDEDDSMDKEDNY